MAVEFSPFTLLLLPRARTSFPKTTLFKPNTLALLVFLSTTTSFSGVPIAR